MEDIEARGRDPSRLFGNRGCALLQEEKERKKIMKVFVVQIFLNSTQLRIGGLC